MQHNDDDDAAERVRAFIRKTIPELEAKGVKLSRYGNHSCVGACCSQQEYDVLRRLPSGTLDFDIEGVVYAISDIRACGLFVRRKTVNRRNGTSYGLKHVLESWRAANPSRCRGGYMANGDFIIAMMMLGYKASFVVFREQQVNAAFNIGAVRQHKR